MRFPTTAAAAAALLAGLFVTAPAAKAATATTTFAVTLTVLNQCVVTATPLVFGSLALVSGGGQATNTVTVTCTAGTPFTVGLDRGTAPAATIATRLLRGPTPATTSSVAYTLYRDSARTLLWGDTVDTQLNGGAATGLPQPFTVYGQILPNQGTAPAGAYTDTITVTVTYP